MSRFTITCRCGKQFHLTSESVGRRISCRCERRAGRLLNWRVVPPALATLFARWLAIASWTYLVTVCLIAVVMWTLGDRWWLGTILLFIGRWIFLLPLVALVPGAVIWARRALVPLAIAALFASSASTLAAEHNWPAKCGAFSMK